MSHETADTLTQELRAATGAGSVEYAPMNGEYIIWPTGEPCPNEQSAREAIRKIAAEDRFSE